MVRCSKTAPGGTRPKWIRGGSSMLMLMEAPPTWSEIIVKGSCSTRTTERFNLGDDGFSSLHGIAMGGRPSERGCRHSARCSTKLTSAASRPPACHTKEVRRRSSSQLPQRGKHGCPRHGEEPWLCQHCRHLPDLSKAQASTLFPTRRTRKETQQGGNNNHPVKLWAIVRSLKPREASKIAPT